MDQIKKVLAKLIDQIKTFSSKLMDQIKINKIFKKKFLKPTKCQTKKLYC